MYGVVQFAASEGGTVAVVVTKWLTPKKTETFWPPTKEPKAFDKLLQQCTSPNERWPLYGIDRVFYETDQLDKAKKKLKLAEITSDMQTSDDDEAVIKIPSKRIVKRNNKYISSDDNEDEDNLPRPPPLKKPLSTYIQSQSSTDSTDTELMLKPGSQGTQQAADFNRNHGHGAVISPPDDTNISECDNNSGETSGLPGLNSTLTCKNSKCDNNSGETSGLPELNSTLTCKNSKCGFQDKVVSLLAHIKAQNDIIMTLLQDRGNTIKPETLKPEFKFPLENFEDLETVERLLAVKENYTNVVAYFKSLGGQGVNNKVSRVMKYALSDSIASKFNFYGKRSDKKPFAELRLRASIVESLKSADITEKHIEDSIKGWLKHAPERTKKRLSNSKEITQRD